jgi:hypothetical protein
MFTTAEILTPEFRQWQRTVKKKGAICTRCASHHFDPLHKMCRTCRALSAAGLASWRVAQKRQKLCVYCVGGQADHSIAACEYHLEYARERNQRVRDEQRAAGLCIWGRCRNRSRSGEGGYCEAHLKAMAAYKAA